jgi:hypothetical protein
MIKKFQATSIKGLLKEDINAQLAIRKLKPENRGLKPDHTLKGQRPLPTFRPLSATFTPEILDFIKKYEIDFCEIIEMADFMIHFQLIRMRKLGESDEYSNAEFQSNIFDFVQKFLSGDSAIAAEGSF